MDSTATFHTIGMTIGLTLLFFGYRFYKPAVFFGGFTLGAVLAFEYVLVHSKVGAYGAGMCAGIVLGTLGVLFYQLGVFFLGACGVLFLLSFSTAYFCRA